jgi:hypothetical protein
MHRPDRPLDFGQILVLKDTAPSLEALIKGGESARRAFGQSGSVLLGGRWEWSPQAFFEVRQSVLPVNRALAMEAFMLKAFDLEKTNPVQQLLLESQGQRVLLTRMHHALADGLGALEWVAHQMAVARGEEPQVEEPRFAALPELKTHLKARRKTPVAGFGGSTRLWSNSVVASAERRWKALEIDASAWRARLKNQDGLRYNDVLAGVCLEAMCRWNQAHGSKVEGLSLWHPVNIRTDPFDGFGNGSSRVRIYREDTESLLSRCRSVHRQMAWSKKHGEWHLPQPAVFSWPLALQRPLVKAVLNRPWVDMGSMLFSHMEKAGPEGERLFEQAESLQWIGMLDRRFPAGFVGATHGARTWLTLTWDLGMWSDEDASEFLGIYEALLETVARELEAGFSNSEAKE